jgi:hypothetical protein
MLWLPAQATSSARFADIWSRRSTEYGLASASICEVSTAIGWKDSGALIRSTVCGSDAVTEYI